MILIIGYGNSLRGDDAIGQQMAQAMGQALKHSDIRVLIANQLMPELVDPIRSATLVIFIDACIGVQPGEVRHERVEPQPGTGAFTHHVSPAALLSAARSLYGATPAGVLISIVGAQFDYGCELSPELQRRLPKIADQVKEIIESSARVQVYEEIDFA
ncbi:MAG TPA: hydrogenase maturation protease [Phototrophicaceae bacterium]|nr:hydrogenase maturation protease [Phototrophicaceae bacterium]